MAGWGAAAQIVSNMFSSGLQAHQAFEMQKRSFRHARMMYRKRYQRTMIDMRLAGLNPILAYRVGAGAGAPGGGGGGGIGPTPPGVGQAFEASAATTRAQKRQDRLLEQERLRVRSQTKLASEQGAAAQAASQVDVEHAKTIDQLRVHQVNSARWEAESGRLGIPRQQRDAEIYDSPGGAFTRYLERLMGPVGSAARAVRPRGGGITIQRGR